ncbi:AI-2E family transporter [Leptothermofonsia sichuanensis E412]|uniref:AI-2E family transporter n=1 Tax=Leptothermofonsia sichuanensis TaxID=2917832 RepID=UPI001CA63E18|nr:AI-2E family transporter [Leptothermofonsia sichuanensis]QZZ20315.1 AI-2E family transporter [Leptothermofonsia sichuanensis E412]
MHRSVKPQRLLVLGLIGPIVALNVWLLSQIFRYFEHLITLLVIAAILAFLLNYPVRLFQYLRLSRSQAVTVVLLVTFAVLVLAGLTLVPLVTIQTTQLVNKIPEWLEASRQNLDAFDFWAKRHNLPLDLKGFSGRINTQIESQLQTLASQAVGLALGTLSGIIDTILVLVLAFYMLLYGGRLWQGSINLFPPQIGIPLSESLRLNFQNFFITQILLAIFMAIALIPIFISMQVPFALLFAILIGISELIPFIGAALGIGLVTLVVMLQDVGLGLQVGIAATILHQIRDNILAPRMMGDFIGLNPIWIVIALLVGLQIAGFLGVVIAVPIAGTIKGTLEVILGIQSQELGKESIPEQPLEGELGDEG